MSGLPIPAEAVADREDAEDWGPAAAWPAGEWDAERWAPTPRRLTAKQDAILRFVVHKIKAEGYPPSFREIRDQFGFASPNSVFLHLKLIERKGWIVRGTNMARAIHVLALPTGELLPSRRPGPMIGGGR